MISFDALRYDHLFRNRDKKQVTPFLDKMASKGVKFSNHLSTGSGTSTSFPGIHASALPLDYGYAGVNENHTTLAEILSENGIQTIGVTAQTSCSRVYNYHRGFDTFEDWVTPANDGGNSGGTGTYLKSRLASVIESLPVISPIASELKLQFDGLRDIYDTPPCPYPQADEVTETTLSLIDEHADDDSDLFLWVHYMEPHAPYYPPEKYIEGFHTGDFDIGRIRRTVRKARRARPEIIDGSMVEAVSEAEVEALRDFYAASACYVDAEAERLFDGLCERGILDDSLLFFTADHGEELFDRGTLGHRTKMYEDLVHVPLIVCDSSGQYCQQSVHNTVTSHVDLAPTIVDHFDISAPNKWRGISLVDLLDGERDTLERDYVFSELCHTSGLGGEINLDNVVASVRSDRWKYIQNRQLGREELYNIRTDPGEQSNQIDDCTYIAEKMRGRLQRRLSDVTETSQTVEVSEEVQEQLRELGYTE
nr:sulfatase-like hydrolase/transferase [Halomicroarcula laminariae]